MAFVVRGMSKNLVAVAIPIAVTIFMTDVLVRAIEQEGAEATRAIRSQRKQTSTINSTGREN